MIDSRAPAQWGRRHSVLAMCSLAMFIAYTDRVNMSVAAVAMLDEFHWSETVKGVVLSAFFWGYLLFMIPSGWLAARFGGKRVLGFAVLWWSLFTILTPFAATLSFSALFAARVCLGAGEAAVMPGAYDLFGRWVPAGERSRALARFLSGIPIGQIVGFAVAGWLTGKFGWPMSFYVFGAVGAVWAGYWFFRIHNDPADDAQVSSAERQLLSDAGGQRTSDTPRESILPYLRRAPVLAVFVAHFANNWTLYLLLAWLPSYFHKMGLSYSNAGLYSAAPWLTAFFTGNLAGIVADRAIARGASMILVRKVTTAASLIGAAVFLVLVRDVHSPEVALGLVCAATGALTIGWSGFTPNMLDIAPRHGAALIGVSNTFATIPGIAGIAVTGWLVDHTGGYAATFLVTAAIATGGAIFYAIFASTKRVDL